jgi:hypothetical protein
MKYVDSLEYYITRNFVVYRGSLLFFIGIVSSRSLQLVVHVARVGETRNAYRILVGELLVKWSLETLGRKWGGE